MRTSLIFLAGLGVGALALAAVRLAALPPLEHDDPVHYHANFLVYLDGERVRFQDARYMQDLASCRLDAALLGPQDRAHLHQGIDDVVHVHASGVTWGHFFANLGFALADGLIVDDEGRRFSADSGHVVRVLINGQRAPSLPNREIVSLDRMLLYHGPANVSDDSIAALFEDVPQNADDFNASHSDGVGCTAGDVHEETFGERVRRAIWF